LETRSGAFFCPHDEGGAFLRLGDFRREAGKIPFALLQLVKYPAAQPMIRKNYRVIFT
jgi:hypothetical protein